MGVYRIETVASLSEGWDFSYILGIISRLIPSLICISIHELSHGLAAYHLGDDTAKRAGRLSLNPLKHLDPIGLLMLLAFSVGWAKPVPINMRNFKNPKRGMAISALAGPASNVVLALIFLLLYGIAFVPLGRTEFGDYILKMLQFAAYLSLALAVFNMLPFPPLDGSKVLFSLISDEAYMKLMRYERYGGIILLLLMWSGLIARPLSALIGLIYSRLIPIAQWACDMVVFFFYQ